MNYCSYICGTESGFYIRFPQRTNTKTDTAFGMNKNNKTLKGRPKSVRKISFIPTVSGFKPYGGNTKNTKTESVFLLYEEHEALRLNDYEKHTQCESAAIMGVSRPTFTRIYMSAREKIAKAFIEGRRIIIEGGKVELNSEWFVCKDCHAIFTANGTKPDHCALCNGTSIAHYEGHETEEPAETESTGNIARGMKMEQPGSNCCNRHNRRHCGRTRFASQEEDIEGKKDSND